MPFSDSTQSVISEVFNPGADELRAAIQPRVQSLNDQLVNLNAETADVDAKIGQLQARRQEIAPKVSELESARSRYQAAIDELNSPQG